MRPLAVLAVLALASPAAAQATSPSLRIESFSIIVPDYDAAKRWYVEKLGFAVVRDQAFGPAERFLLVAPPGQTEFGIVLQKAKTAPNPREPEMQADYSDRVGKTVNVVLHANDVTAYARGLQARGVELTSPVRKMPWGAQATFKDLYGNTFVVVGSAGTTGAPKSDNTRP